jgi:DHA2 family multidrug resistance protein-like MFS transporter
MMIPMVLGSMGMKRIVVQVVNRFGYRRAGGRHDRLAAGLLFMAVALLGWYYVLPLVLFCQGIINSMRFSSMNTLTLKDLPDELASSNSLLSMIMQLSMSGGRSPDCSACTGSTISARHPRRASGLFYTLSMAVIIAPAFILPECRMIRSKIRD